MKRNSVGTQMRFLPLEGTHNRSFHFSMEGRTGCRGLGPASAHLSKPTTDPWGRCLGSHLTVVYMQTAFNMRRELHLTPFHDTPAETIALDIGSVSLCSHFARADLKPRLDSLPQLAQKHHVSRKGWLASDMSWRERRSDLCRSWLARASTSRNMALDTGRRTHTTPLRTGSIQHYSFLSGVVSRPPKKFPL
jgi:hypothetical protein